MTKKEIIKDDIENDEEILELKNQVESKLKEKQKEENQTYTRKEVDAILKSFEEKFLKSRESDDEDFIDILDPTAHKRKFVRLPRLNNKFVVGMKNMNTDSYLDEPIYVTNVEHPTKGGEYIPWATFIYEDGTEELYPYLSFMKRAVGVWGEVIEEKKEEKSETFGLVDVKTMEDDEWNMKTTGKKVISKALKYKTTYVCRDIIGNKILEFSEDVINKADAPYADLKKYLEETK